MSPSSASENAPIDLRFDQEPHWISSYTIVYSDPKSRSRSRAISYKTPIKCNTKKAASTNLIHVPILDSWCPVSMARFFRTGHAPPTQPAPYQLLKISFGDDIYFKVTRINLPGSRYRAIPASIPCHTCVDLITSSLTHTLLSWRPKTTVSNSASPSATADNF